MDASQLRDVSYVDEPCRGIGAVLHAVKEINAASFDDGAVLELRKRGLDSGTVCESEGIHRASIDG
jgi:hypothetical protein